MKYRSFQLSYLLTVLHGNNEATAEGFQVRKWFFQVIQSICIGNSGITSFLNVFFSISFPWFLNKMFDCLNGLYGHLFTSFHRELLKEALNSSLEKKYWTVSLNVTLRHDIRHIQWGIREVKETKGKILKYTTLTSEQDFCYLAFVSEENYTDTSFT